jgi:hypothetical protein
LSQHHDHSWEAGWHRSSRGWIHLVMWIVNDPCTASQVVVVSKRERTNKINCQLITEKENSKHTSRQKTIHGEARYVTHSPKLHSCSRGMPPPHHMSMHSARVLQATALMRSTLCNDIGVPTVWRAR